MAGSDLPLSACARLAALSAGPALAGPNLVTNGNFRGGSEAFTTGYTLTTMIPYRFQNGVHDIYTVEKAGKIALLRRKP